jgi:O-antigen ligase
MEIEKKINIFHILPVFLLAAFIKSEYIFLFFSFALIVYFIYNKSVFYIDNPFNYFFIWLSISSFFSINSVESFYVSWRFFVYIVIFSIIYEKPQSYKSAILKMIIFISGFLMLLIFYNFFFMGSVKGYEILGKNKNYSASLFSICAIYFYHSFLNKEELWPKILNLLAFSAFFFSIILLNSRGSFLALFFLMTITSYIYLKKKYFKIYLGVFLLLFVSLLYFYDPFKISEPNSYMRPYIWLSSLKAILNYPLTGIGPGFFEYAFSKFKFAYFDGASFYNHTTVHAHSEILNIAVESGILGVFLFIYSLYKTLLVDMDFKNIFSLMALSLLIQSLFDLIFYSSFMWIIFFSLLALSKHREDFKEKLKPKSSALISISLIVLMLIPKFLKNYNLEFCDMKAIDNELISDNSARKTALSDIYINFYPKDIRFYYTCAYYYHLTGNDDIAKKYLLKLLFIEPYNKEALKLLYDINRVRENFSEP